MSSSGDLSAGELSLTTMVWLPPPSELGPAPLPPCEGDGVSEEKKKQTEPNSTEPSRFFGELPVIAHNISLLELQVRFISNPSNKVSNEVLARLTASTKAMKNWKTNLEQFLSTFDGNKKYENHCIKLCKRMGHCLQEYENWKKKQQIPFDSLIHNKRKSQPWNRRSSRRSSDVPTFEHVTRKRGASVIGFARQETKQESPSIGIQVIEDITVYIEKEEIVGECSICWEDMTTSVEGEEREFMLLCGHSFCFKCLHSLSIMATYDPLLVLILGCPWQDCTHKLDDTEVQLLIDPMTFQDYIRNHFYAEKQKDPSTRYCTKPDCSALIDTEVDTFPQIICPSCLQEYCFHCSEMWHDGISCNQQKNKADNGNAEFADWIEQNGNTKPCPQCNIPIEKISGCNHMTCASCSHQFCWVCLQNYSLNHYRVGNCAGKQFHGVNYSFQEHVDTSNPNVVPPPIFNEVRVTSDQRKDSSLLVSVQKKKRILALPRFFPRKRSRARSQTNLNRASMKIALLGDTGVGKSPLVLQYTRGEYSDFYDPTIEDSSRKQIQIGENAFIMEILDTGGMEEFSAMRDQWIRESEAFMVVFSCTSQSSVDVMSDIIDQIDRVKDSNRRIPMILVGNKFDLDTEYDYSLTEVTKISHRYHCPLIFTSARFDINVTEAFQQIAKSVLESDKCTQ